MRSIPKKKEREVAEIVEAESFKHLQEKAQKLRDLNINTEISSTHTDEGNTSFESNSEEIDFFSELQQKGKKLQNQNISNSDEEKAFLESETTEEIDFLSQLQKKSENLQNRQNNNDIF